MHDSEHVLKTHVFGRRKDPPGGLQLVNLSQPLYPWMINQFLFGCFTGGQTLAGDERDIAVNGIVGQAF
jgi:hypothetical protein